MDKADLLYLDFLELDLDAVCAVGPGISKYIGCKAFLTNQESVTHGYIQNRTVLNYAFDIMRLAS